MKLTALFLIISTACADGAQTGILSFCGTHSLHACDSLRELMACAEIWDCKPSVGTEMLCEHFGSWLDEVNWGDHQMKNTLKEIVDDFAFKHSIMESVTTVDNLTEVIAMIDEFVEVYTKVAPRLDCGLVL